ncbi:uncharacterized protein N7446_013789 [Penicillium canescens]|uniref:uncharacterized protein n=1 Tax=Penicillium canescens TaxID=5083 RepID=UPI0026DEB42F|nr:uncharacterized protein N7446_013789 [Penicillium canescens]KAJ6042723.1 hypothetical protein N7446_013789 [Penicillium canescens]
MAPEAPDPQSLKSWHDAFQYPIPTVRRVEQELRRDIASNKEKLRALVGMRYRDLVGTAETIVAMNRDIQDVETVLADVGRRCNPRLVERKHVHARQIKSGDVEKNADKHAFGAQLALLHRCTTSITRLLRRRASLLLISKILVVSRLLHKTLSQHESVPPFLDDLRNQLAPLWRTLLKRIEKRLASTGATEDDIIESLAAYCLATSSSSDDAIHHFHQVRLDVIASQLDLSRENIPKALQLFVRTLQTSKVLRHRQFSEVLSKLKARPILADPEIRSLDGLEVEVLGRWVAPVVKNFTPWIKLSELNRTDGIDSIKEWSLQAFEKFAEGCQKDLAHSNDFSELLSLRASTESGRGRRQSLFHCLGLGKKEHESVRSLWDGDLIVAEYSNGAQTFKQTVADRLLGRDEDVSTVLVTYKAWLTSIQEVNESIDSLRRMRWTDILVGGEVEDEDIDITPRLNEDDPRLLSDALHSAVRESFNNLQTSFSSAFKSFGSSHSSEKATFLLRLIRLVRRDIPARFVAGDFVFSSDIVPELQKLLASEAVAKTGSLKMLPSSKTHPQTGKAKMVPGRSLWEGNPAVPVQPSASTFKFLRRLTSTMDTCGSDLWDPSTVQALKQALKKELETAITSSLDDLESPDSPSKSETNDEEPATNGDKDQEKEPAEYNTEGQVDALRDWKMQLFFDSLYLSRMLGEQYQLADVVARAQKSADPSAEAVKTIRQSANEYWARTELLFGLLAER